MTPEFSRIIAAETVDEAPRQLEIGADAEERRKLAGRFRLQAIDRLIARVKLSRRAGIIHAEGEIDSNVVQSCVVTGEAMPAEVRAPFSVRYVPDAFGRSDEDEVELSSDDCDTLPLENNQIDLGELAAETLALALDPFPRSDKADEALQEAGAGEATEAGPFAALQALKDKLEGGRS
jgi:uncharacterized metal-binding protein YceD (DUF177 family)